jgi:hypothetical protein
MTQVIPEQFIEKVRARLAVVDEQGFELCKLVSDGWDELKKGLIHYKQIEHGWTDKQAPGRTHRWFLSSLAAEVGCSESSMYKYKKIGDYVIKYDLRQDNLTQDHYLRLMQNAPRTDDGHISKETMVERLEWLNKETDKFGGQVPSPRDIEKHFRQNGDKPEWLIYFQRMIDNAKKIISLDNVPDKERGMAGDFLWWAEEQE